MDLLDLQEGWIIILLMITEGFSSQEFSLQNVTTVASILVQHILTATVNNYYFHYQIFFTIFSNNHKNVHHKFPKGHLDINSPTILSLQSEE